MRARAIAGSIIFLLSLMPVAVEAGPQGKTSSADIDLGTATLEHLEWTVSPFSTALGLYDRFMVGSYTVPWFTWVLAPESVVPNLFVKAEIWEHQDYSLAISTSLFYARINDLQGDGLDVRAWIWPIRLHGARKWNKWLTTSLELTMVYSTLSATHLSESGAEAYGVALARSAHTGLIQRLRLARWFSLWTRVRILLGHSPLVADVESQISESTHVHVRARANASELSSGMTGVLGIHLEWSRFAFTAGAGYGTWFLPAILLPVGHNTWIGEMDFYFRF